MNILIHIKSKAPQVFSEIYEFIEKYYQNQGKELTTITDYIAIAIVLHYMNENAIEMSLSDISLETLEQEILEIITTFEATIKHYS